MDNPSHEIRLPSSLSHSPWLVMGILNVTPDSFHDGGRYFDPEVAVVRAREMAAAGAGIIDVGGESTRPGAPRISEREELERVIPVISAIAPELYVPISVDTSKAAVAGAALKAGAAMVNDVTALRGDPDMAAVVVEAGCPVCLMHMQGEPGTMQKDPRYHDVVAEIGAFFEERVAWAVAQGIRRDNIILDPGIGFGKKLEHNLAIIRHFEQFLSLGLPLMIGASRKSFIGMIMEDDGSSAGGSSANVTGGRLPGTIATSVIAYQKGVSIFRVHDVAENCQALKVTEAIYG